MTFLVQGRDGSTLDETPHAEEALHRMNRTFGAVRVVTSDGVEIAQRVWLGAASIGDWFLKLARRVR